MIYCKSLCLCVEVERGDCPPCISAAKTVIVPFTVCLVSGMAIFLHKIQRTIDTQKKNSDDFHVGAKQNETPFHSQCLPEPSEGPSPFADVVLMCSLWRGRQNPMPGLLGEAPLGRNHLLPPHPPPPTFIAQIQIGCARVLQTIMTNVSQNYRFR